MDAKESKLAIFSDLELKAEKGELLVIGQIMDNQMADSFFPQDVIEKCIETFNGKEVRDDHVMPELDSDKLVGQVKKVWLDPQTKKPMGAVVIGKDTEAERKFQSILIADSKRPTSEKMYKGFSVGVKSFFNDSGECYKFFGREISFAKDPALKSDGFTQVRKFNMPEDTALKAIIERFDGQAAALKTSFEAQEKALKSKVDEFSGTIQAQQKKIDELGAALKAKDSEIQKFKEETEKVKKEAEDTQKLTIANALAEIEGFDGGTEPYKTRIAELLKNDHKTLVAIAESTRNALQQFTKRSGGMPAFGDMSLDQLKVNTPPKQKNGPVAVQNIGGL